MNKNKLGVALVGLGNYATGQLAPALLQTTHCYLAGIVTGTPAKAASYKAQYNISDKNSYTYENFDSIKDNSDIDIVYVALPNSLHAAYTIRAAQAGKHVICEKPMALTLAECDAMIAACKEAGKFLSIGYRLHFDPHHADMIRMGMQKEYGKIKKIVSQFLQPSTKGEWRLNKQIAGGGPLMDLGIYSLQAVMYITGMEPVAVTAQTYPVSDKEKFIDIEETLDWQMEMPDGIIAECRTSYSGSANTIRVEAESGWFELDPAFYYSGLKGRTASGKIIEYAPLSQQAEQLDGIALAIKEGKPSIVPGEMGRKDLKIIEAIYEAMKKGKRITIKNKDKA
jgi:predicted dehydrogenase